MSEMTKVLTAVSQKETSPEQAQELLALGNKRFLLQQTLKRDLLGQVKGTASGQYPLAVVLSCIDSRIPTELIFDQGIGDIFNARIAGNFVNPDILGSMEFACKLAGSKLVVVMGHTSCGAVKGACDHAELGNLTHLLSNITPAVDLVETKADEDRSSKNRDFVNRVSTKNVELTIAKIREDSPVLAEMEQQGAIKIVGAMYHVENGSVDFFPSEEIV